MRFLRRASPMLRRVRTRASDNIIGEMTHR
jgi:hypothetical protein